MHSLLAAAFLSSCGSPSVPDKPSPTTIVTHTTSATGNHSVPGGTGTTTTTTTTPEPTCGHLDRIVQIGGTGGETVLDLHVTADGGLLMTGRFDGVVDFSPEHDDPGDTLYGHADDIYVAKYAADGHLQWLKHVYNTGYENGLAVAEGPDGQVALAAKFSSSLLLINDEAVTISGVGTVSNGLLMVFDADGNLQWHKTMVGDGIIEATATTIGADGTVWVMGNYASPGVTFPDDDGRTLDNTSPSVATDWIWIAKYADDGTLLWTETIESRQDNYVRGIDLVALDGGGVMVYAKSWGDAVLKRGTPQETFVAAYGWLTNLTAEYSATGDLVSARHVAGDNSAEVGQLRAAPGGVIEGADVPTNATIVMEDGSELQVTERGSFFSLQSEGEQGPHTIIQTSTVEFITVEAVDWRDGQVGMAGYLAMPTTFGAGAKNEVTFSPKGFRDAWLTLHDADGTFRCAWQAKMEAKGHALDLLTSMAFDHEGGVWIGGYFQGDATFDEGLPTEVKLSTAGSADIYLARYLLEGPPKKTAP